MLTYIAVNYLFFIGSCLGLVGLAMLDWSDDTPQPRRFWLAWALCGLGGTILGIGWQ